jgi:hypothetical protein
MANSGKRVFAHFTTPKHSLQLLPEKMKGDDQKKLNPELARYVRMHSPVSQISIGCCFSSLLYSISGKVQDGVSESTYKG